MADVRAEKLHAACDECRTRKLKCNGETPGCSRCGRENIRCVYSPQKPMGRPRKRRKEDVSIPAEEVPAFLDHDHLNPRTDLGSFTGEEGAEEASAPAEADLENSLNSGPPLGLGVPTILNDHVLFAETDFTSFVGGDMSNSLVVPPYHDLSITNGFPQDKIQNTSYNLDPTIDPSLWNAATTTTQLEPTTNIAPSQSEPPCTCLSIMYLALSDLQNISSFAFPGIIPAQRHAMDTASTIIHCKKCPKDTLSSMQNTSSLNSLLTSIAERFHKCLRQIDEQAEELERTGQKKQYRVGDSDPGLHHFHTGTPECPMGFNIELDAKDWKVLAKKVLKTEVYGGGSNPTPLVTLLDQFELRQHKWHADRENLEERTRIFGEQNVCQSGDATCVRMINAVRKMVANMQWG